MVRFCWRQRVEGYYNVTRHICNMNLKNGSEYSMVWYWLQYVVNTSIPPILYLFMMQYLLSLGWFQNGSIELDIVLSGTDKKGVCMQRERKIHIMPGPMDLLVFSDYNDFRWACYANFFRKKKHVILEVWFLSYSSWVVLKEKYLSSL